MKNILFAAMCGIGLASLVLGPLSCAAVAPVVGPTCAAVRLADSACTILVPVIGADGKTTLVPVPADEIRRTAAMKIGAPVPSGSR